MTNTTELDKLYLHKKYKAIRNNIDAPEWHINWFSQHYAIWLSKADPKEITFFYGSYIEKQFADYLRDLGYNVKLRRPLDSDEHLVVYLSKEDYFMERLKIDS